MEIKLIREKAILLRKKISLRTFPVGVKFIKAIPNSRSKSVYLRLKGKGNE